MADRYAVLGLAHVRSSWFREVARWATEAAIPVDFVKCISTEEIRARFGAGRSFSALMLDGGMPGIDRDLMDVALEAGAAVLVVNNGRAQRDWIALGATAVLPEDFHRGELLEVLERHTRPINTVASVIGTTAPEDQVESGWSGRFVSVTGGGGAGSSTVAMALAQGLGDDPRYADLTLLADLALRADLAMLHDARDVVPGVQELIEAHRSGFPSLAEVRSLVFDASDRHYHLLLGLRRQRDWAVVRPRALQSALDSLSRSYRVVVADIEPDLEGEDECGSIEVEERNQLARSVSRRSELVVVVGIPTMKGLHDTLRIINELVQFGVDPQRILPVLNRSGRPGRNRAEITAAFGQLVAPISPNIVSPVHLPERKRLEETMRDGGRLPSQLTKPVASAVIAMLDRTPENPAGVVGAEPAPVPVTPGSLGQFLEDDGQGPV